MLIQTYILFEALSSDHKFVQDRLLKFNFGQHIRFILECIVQTHKMNSASDCFVCTQQRRLWNNMDKDWAESVDQLLKHDI